VPVHPELVSLLRSYLEQHGTGPQGRVFVGARGGALTDRAYLAVFHKARGTAFSRAEAASLLARRPYDLRHAAVSTWLNAGVAPPQVAEMGGPQCGRAATGLRQVHRRAAGRGHAADPRSDQTRRRRHHEQAGRSR
jgi:integrase